jgi:hypothetical protein
MNNPQLSQKKNEIRKRKREKSRTPGPTNVEREKRTEDKKNLNKRTNQSP